jgi:hypothetical protein
VEMRPHRWAVRLENVVVGICSTSTDLSLTQCQCLPSGYIIRSSYCLVQCELCGAELVADFGLNIPDHFGTFSFKNVRIPFSPQVI